MDRVRANEHDMYKPPEMSEWVCYMFGGSKGDGLCWQPKKGNEPNRFVRWMMKVCFACTWVKEG
jgi:hypothetical protein